MDSGLLSLLNGFAASGGTAGEIARLLAQDAIFLLIGVLAIAALLPGSVAGRRVALSALLASGLGLGVGQFLAQLWDRARPFADGSGTHALIAHSADSSFPSDHAIVAFAIAASLLFWNRRVGVAAFAVAALVCLARVSVCVHYPTDVLVGAAVGTGAAMIVQLSRPQGLVRSIADRVGSFYEWLLALLHLTNHAEQRAEG
ncbi:MAG: phosphatase PAP2 family protein [Solirubrobacterales bacterium]